MTLTADKAQKLKVADLKTGPPSYTELGKRGLDTSGKKEVLVDRLVQHITADEQAGQGLGVRVELPAAVHTISTSPTVELSQEEKLKLRAARFGLPVVQGTDKPIKTQKSTAANPAKIDAVKPVDKAKKRSAQELGIHLDPSVVAKRKAKFGTVEPRILF